MRRGCVLAVVLWICAVPVAGQELPSWIEGTEVSGLVFGDAYWVAESHDPEIEGESGFWIRRIYLTLDKELSERLDLRLRLEASSPGDFESSDRIEPFFKDAWVRWSGERTDLYAGLSPTPTWAVIESFWGYRAVEKTPLDLQRMGGSRDLGVALRGSFDPDRRVRYHAMLGNGSGTRGETDEGKKVMLAVGYHPSESFVAQVYGDFEERDDEEERTTGQAFVGWRWNGGRAGFQVAHQEREPLLGPSVDLGLASVFAVVELTDRVNALARVDRTFDPNPGADGISYVPFSSRAESTFLLAGVELVLDDHLSIIPNLEAVLYDDPVDGGEEPDSELIPRLTVDLRF